MNVYTQKNEKNPRTIQQQKSPVAKTQRLAFIPPETTSTSLMAQMKTAQIGVKRLAYAPQENASTNPVQRKVDTLQAKCDHCGEEEQNNKSPSNAQMNESTSTENQAHEPTTETEQAPSSKKSHSEIPLELLAMAQDVLNNSGNTPDQEALKKLGQLAASKLGPKKVAQIANNAGLPGAQKREKEIDAGGQNGTEPIQRQAAEAGAVAGTMWWLTVIDGPLPVGDIIYGALVLGAAVTGALVANEAVEYAACTIGLQSCLNNPWQPDWNKDNYGPRKDCGACFRECNHANGVWPSYKCPL